MAQVGIKVGTGVNQEQYSYIRGHTNQPPERVAKHLEVDVSIVRQIMGAILDATPHRIIDGYDDVPWHMRQSTRNQKDRF